MPAGPAGPAVRPGPAVPRQGTQPGTRAKLSHPGSRSAMRLRDERPEDARPSDRVAPTTRERIGRARSESRLETSFDFRSIGPRSPCGSCHIQAVALRPAAHFLPTRPIRGLVPSPVTRAVTCMFLVAGAGFQPATSWLSRPRDRLRRSWGRRPNDMSLRSSSTALPSQAELRCSGSP